jgi:hypothetical protein
MRKRLSIPVTFQPAGGEDMTDPISRLEVVQREIDRVFGEGYAREHPDIVAAVMQTAASDWAAARIAVAIERVAAALLVEEEPQHIVPRELLRVRP